MYKSNIKNIFLTVAAFIFLSLTCTNLFTCERRDYPKGILFVDDPFFHGKEITPYVYGGQLYARLLDGKVVAVELIFDLILNGNFCYKLAGNLNS